ncbi:CACNA1H [Symbiodinium sp. KB8]|nr:CACNA1H [Symbiodinium sp. KB8]
MPWPRKSSESLKAAASSLAAIRQELFLSHQQLVQKLDAELVRIQNLCSTSADSLGPAEFAALSESGSRGSKGDGPAPVSAVMQLPGMPEESDGQQDKEQKEPAGDVNEPVGPVASASLATFTTIAEQRKKHMAWIRKVEDGKVPRGSKIDADDEEESRVFSRLNPEFAAQKVRKDAISKFGSNLPDETSSYTNCCTRIVQHSCFERLSMMVIGMNALWIAIDIEINQAETLLQAGVGTILAEAAFFLYFTAELFIRFWAQQHARNLLKDYWFLFDAGLVMLMLLETWLVPAIILMVGAGEAGGLGRAASVLRVVRLLRVLRTARIARIARYMPELMILIKGLIVAARSVFFTLVLLLLMTYVFSIALVSLSQGPDLHQVQVLFPSVPRAVLRLLVQCTMPDSEAFFQSLEDESILMAALFLVFILAGSLIVLNMLVGILVEAVQTVATMEHEQIHVDFAQRVLHNLIQQGNADEDGDNLISEGEFERLLERPEAFSALTRLGVDIFAAREYGKLLFEDGVPLTFPEFMESILTLRGSNQTTVKDIVNLRKFVAQEFSNLHTILMDFFHLVGGSPVSTSRPGERAYLDAVRHTGA